MNRSITDTLKSARRRKARIALREVKLPGERFRWLTGFRILDNLYLISSLGRVFEVYEHPPKDAEKGRFEPLFEPLHVADKGIGPVRVRIFLRKDGRSKVYDPAWLVAKRFLPPQPSGYILVHRDSDPKNCRAENLVWRRKRRQS